MQYALSVNFEGAVSESETEESRTLTLIGSGEPPESTDQWRLSARFAWLRTPNTDTLSAQAELQAPMGATLHGTLRSGAVNTVTDGGGMGEAWMLDLDFTVDQSSRWFAGTHGAIHLGGTATRQGGFQLTANLELDAPDNAWFPLNGGLLTDAEADSGASHTGPNPLRRAR